MWAGDLHWNNNPNFLFINLTNGLWSTSHTTGYEIQSLNSKKTTTLSLSLNGVVHFNEKIAEGWTPRKEGGRCAKLKFFMRHPVSSQYFAFIYICMYLGYLYTYDSPKFTNINPSCRVTKQCVIFGKISSKWIVEPKTWLNE